VNNFEHHMAQLAAQGFTVERGMLIGAFADPVQIGVRFTGENTEVNTQVDTYLQSAFFDSNKSHPVLGPSSEVAGPEGNYRVFPILKG
jgi:hypothetical protein